LWSNNGLLIVPGTQLRECSTISRDLSCNFEFYRDRSDGIEIMGKTRMVFISLIPARGAGYVNLQRKNICFVDSMIGVYFFISVAYR
jgi:hypothetical protein